MSPDRVSFNSVLDAAARSGQGDASIELSSRMLESMSSSSIPPDMISYNAAIRACVRAGAAESAADFVAALRGDGLHPDDVTFTTLLQGADNDADSWRILLSPGPVAMKRSSKRKQKLGLTGFWPQEVLRPLSLSRPCLQLQQLPATSPELRRAGQGAGSCLVRKVSPNRKTKVSCGRSCGPVDARATRHAQVSGHSGWFRRRWTRDDKDTPP